MGRVKYVGGYSESGHMHSKLVTITRVHALIKSIRYDRRSEDAWSARHQSGFPLVHDDSSQYTKLASVVLPRFVTIIG